MTELELPPEKHIVRFKELSTGLKACIVLAWVYIGIDTLAFIVGFIIGLTG